MNVLCVGDVVGSPGRKAVRALLDEIKKEFEIDFTVINAENAAGGAGLTIKTSQYLLDSGCDILTLGDHVWDQKEMQVFLNETKQIIRPANFPEGAPGVGWCVAETSRGKKVGVINLLGRVFMRYQVSCPFLGLKRIVEEIKKQTKIIIVDLHCEATSEKVAMGHYADGMVSVLFGTHTHVATADETILNKGTAYITDVGMTGPHDSVIGQDKQAILQRFLTSMPIKFSVAEDKIFLNGIIVEVDEKSGVSKSIKRISRSFKR